MSGRPSAFRTQFVTEAKLLAREPAAILFGAVLPLVAITVMAAIPGAREPFADFGGLSVVQTYVPTITLFATLYAVYRLPRMPVDNPQGSPGLRAVWDGLVYLSAHKILLMSFVVDIIAMVFGMPRALFPQLAHESFGGPAEGGLAFALLFAGIPAGAVLGGVLSGWVSRVRREGLAIMWAIAVWGVAMTVMGVAVWFAPLATGAMLGLAVAMLVVGGAADMSSAAFRQSLLLGATDDAVRGRLQGVFIVVVAGGPRIADILHGGAAEVVGPAVATAGGGVLVLVGIAVVALLYPRFHRFRLAGR